MAAKATKLQEDPWRSFNKSAPLLKITARETCGETAQCYCTRSPQVLNEAATAGAVVSGRGSTRRRGQQQQQWQKQVVGVVPVIKNLGKLE